MFAKKCSCFGSWAEKDVDPALFSRQLMANASSLVEDEEVFSYVYYIYMMLWSLYDCYEHTNRT